MAQNLLEAVKKGNVKTVRALLSKGVDLSDNSANNDFIYIAICTRNIEILKLLVEAGANLKEDVYRVGSPLHAALSPAIHSSSEVVKVLVKAGADVNQKNFGGETPLQRALLMLLCLKSNKKTFKEEVNKELFCFVNQDDVKIVKILIDAGADVNPDFTEKSLLHQAVDCEDPEIVKILIDAGASVDTKDSAGYSPLRYAVLYRNEEIVELLVNAGAVIDDSYPDKKTLLHKAIAIDCGENILKALVAASPDVTVNQRDNFGNTALHKQQLKFY